MSGIEYSVMKSDVIKSFDCIKVMCYLILYSLKSV